MFDPNLPDDCQGNNPRFPWNEPEQEINACWHCGDEVDHDKLIEVKTRDHGDKFIAPCCFNEYAKGKV